MHQPRPYGRFSSGELSQEDKAAIDRFARSLTNFKHASQLEGMRLVRELPSGLYAVASDLGGAFRVVVEGKPEDYPFIDRGIARSEIPMFLSGRIMRHQVKTVADDGEIEPVRIRLTEQCRRRLGGYKPEKMAVKDIELRRFAIKYHPKFKYFEPEYTGIYTFTQYTKLIPTWYSGAMSEVVQVAMGFGAQQPADPQTGDDRKDRAEHLHMMLPPKVSREIENELSNLRMPCFEGMPDEEGQIKYEYKPSGNNGVAFGEDGKPWLLSIDHRGVFAMPLPVIPATTTEAFAEYIEENGDTEIKYLLDKYGGIPTGEPFPIGNDLEAWRRAGAVVRVCDTADFYSHESLYMACGWSFNSKGSAAFNTCIEYSDDGLKYVHGYQATFYLGKLEGKAGMLPKSWHQAEEESGGSLSKHLANLYSQINDNTHRSRAIKYKLRRYSGEQLLAMFKSGGASANYWDALEVAPIATHSGSVARVYSGPVHFPGKIHLAAGWIKFPEFTGKGCESFMFINPDYEGPAVKCDTVMFGAYINDELCTIRYFYDERKFKKSEDSSFDDLMILGQWEKTTTTGVTGLSGHAYTNWADDRKETSDSKTITSVTGRPIGYGEPAWNTPPLLFTRGGLGRSWYYEHETQIESESFGSVSTGALVPVYARDSINYAYAKGADNWNWSLETSMKGMADPTSYSIWTYDPIFHWIGGTGKGEPRPTIGEWVYLDEMNYTPFPGSEYADSGNWYGFSGSFMDVTSIAGPYTIRHADTHHANGVVIGGQPPGWLKKTDSKNKRGTREGRLEAKVMFAKTEVIHREIPHPWYFQFSPVDMDWYFYQDANWNCAGETQYSSISEEKSKGVRYSWGKTKLAEGGGFCRFIGVINE